MATTTAPSIPQLVERLRLDVMRLARRLRQQAEPGVSPSMLSALSTIETFGPLTLRRLAEIERIQPPSVTRIVARLEEEGLVARTVHDSDRRFALVSLTERGKRFVARSRSRKNAYLATRLRDLSPAELGVLEAALPVLERVLEDER